MSIRRTLVGTTLALLMGLGSQSAGAAEFDDPPPVPPAPRGVKSGAQAKHTQPAQPRRTRSSHRSVAHPEPRRTTERAPVGRSSNRQVAYEEPLPSAPARQGPGARSPQDLGEEIVYADDGPWTDAAGCGECCADGCGDCCTSGCQGWCPTNWLACPSPFYVRGEFLAWWMTGDNLPPLVSTSPNTVPRNQAGVLGQNTSILFGDEAVNDSGRYGNRIVIGSWYDACVGIEGEWFFLGEQETSYDRSSDGSTILARPFFNLANGQQDANVLAYPNQLQGEVHVNASSRFLGAGVQGMERLATRSVLGLAMHRIDFLFGLRYLRLSENLAINSHLLSIDQQGVVPVGTTFDVADSFDCSNNFFGPNLGLMSQIGARSWTLTTIGRLAFGGNFERVNIEGVSVGTAPGQAPVEFGNGLLAMPTNIGRYSNDAFALVPHLEFKLAYDLSPHLRFNVGYDLLYWSRVARPGPQIDTFVNTTQSSGQQLLGTPGPLFEFRETDLWVQGISVGGELRF